MHYLYCIVEYQGAPFLAKIAVEEYSTDLKHRAYNAQKIRMSALSRSQYNELKSEFQKFNASNTDAISISSLFKLVKTYDKDFRYNSVNASMLTEDGTPKIVFHGTKAEFDTFMHEYIGKNGTSYGKGFYLTDDYEYAESYSARDNGKVYKQQSYTLH